jgi:serine/threonine protein kinase/Flp pilus assembly protein TadD
MSSAFPPGVRLGRYEIRSHLGTGGMGEVYLAQDMTLGRTVALKFLPTDVAQDSQRMHRFIQEAKTASALNHPNILTVFEIGEADEANYIVTEFIDGETLRQHMRRGQLSLRETLDISIQVASALSAAHRAGIVHRDIKPENIMVRHDDQIVKVLDFGLAKQREKTISPSSANHEAETLIINTNPGVVLGTVSYMSPEQARGLTVDERTDIWSLGVVLYEMVSGHLPFEGPTSTDVISLILQREPTALTLSSREASERLDEIIVKALAKDREERYQSVKDLALDLKRLKQRLDVEAEIERSVPAELRETRAAAIERKSLETARGAKARTTAASALDMHAAPPVAGDPMSEARRTMLHALIAFVLLAVAVVGITLFYHYSRRAPSLTEKDTVLLADFVNTTGEAVFDGTLKEALAVQLGQSPFLNLFPEQSVRETLGYMGRSADERITRDIGREICERQGIKALLIGTISGLGSHYVITLEALNGRTGDTFAREQVEAESKEQVLGALGQAASRLRQRLGESLGSIQKFSAPVQQATTASLEALRAFSLGDEQRAKGRYIEAIPHYKRAVEIDPNFALAYARLATLFGNLGQQEQAIEASQKAFALRDRVSERERFYISEKYYSHVTGETEKVIEVLELWTRTYPNDHVPHNNLAIQYAKLGQWEKMLAAAREAVRLSPATVEPYANMAVAFMGLNRVDEARKVLEDGVRQKPDAGSFRSLLYKLAFMLGDRALMQQQVDWAKGKPFEAAFLEMEASTTAYSGERRRSLELLGRSIDLYKSLGLKENAGQTQARMVMGEAFFGTCSQTRAKVTESLTLTRSYGTLMNGAYALARCGETAQALSLTEELGRRYPSDTAIKGVGLPMIRAAVELSRNNPAQAVQLLEPASRYELGELTGYFTAYLRGEAYLRQRMGAEAAAEFKKILDHRGIDPTSPLLPFAQLGLARATALQPDRAAARRAYQDFFALWKNADADLPTLREAREEYEKLK